MRNNMAGCRLYKMTPCLTMMLLMITTLALSEITDQAQSTGIITTATALSTTNKTTPTTSPATTTANKRTPTTAPTTTTANKTTPTTSPATTTANKTTPTTAPATTTANKRTPTTAPATTTANKTTPTTAPATTTANKTTPTTTTPATTASNKITPTTAPATTTANKTTPTAAPAKTTAKKTTPTTAPATANKTTPTTAAATTTANKTTPTTAPATTTANKITPTTAPATTANKTTPTTAPATTTTANKTTPTTTPAPTTTTAAVPGVQKQVYINEILMDTSGSFKIIELQMSESVDISSYAMVMVDGGTNKSMSIVYLKNIVHKQGDLLIVNFTSLAGKGVEPSVKSAGTGIALYDSMPPKSDDWTVSGAGLVDALVIGKTYAGISPHLLTTLTPGGSPYVLDPSIYGEDRTISRCSSNNMRSTEMYALIEPSLGDTNDKNCKARQNYKTDVSMKFTAPCGLLKLPNNSLNHKLVQELLTIVVHKVNKDCKCGLTLMHVLQAPTVQCCAGTSLDMKFVTPNKGQGDQLMAAYQTFIDDTPNVTLAGRTYPLNHGCYSNCCATPTPQPNDNKKNVQITVGVVLACLFVFVVIVIFVVLYLRRKKTAVYQFRMSRLQEDEDDLMEYQNTDDFVGAQEATFDLKR